MSNPASSCLPLAAIEDLIRGTLPAEDQGRAREHVAACVTCARRLHDRRMGDEPLARRVGRTEAAGSSSSGALADLPEIPGHELTEEIHRGAQGIVYRATQVATKRAVAVKVVPVNGASSDRVRRRFERELDLVATLRHPNIVTVLDGGVTGGVCHLTMELVKGLNLDEHLAREKPDVRQTLELFVKICAAVAHAQQRGIIHRDLKPSNVRVDPGGEPRLLDFGLAKVAHPDGGQPTLTAAAAFMGTWAYASPEQARGASAEVDVRSDVYSLGVVLYEMLTGQLPYDVSGDLLDVAKTITESAVSPPSKTRHGVNAELDTIVQKALAKEPNRRYVSADALKLDVERLLAGEAIDAKRDNALYVIGKLARRHRPVIASAVMVLAVAVVGALGVWSERRERIHEQERARSEEAHALALADLLESLIGLASPDVSGSRTVSGARMVETTRHWIDAEVPDKPEVKARLLHALGRAMAKVRLPDPQPYLEEALAIQRSTLGDRHPDVATTMNTLGAVASMRGQKEQALAWFESAMEIRSDVLGPEHELIVGPLHNIARVHRLSGDLDEAERLELRAIAILQAQPEPNQLLLGEVVGGHARILQGRRDLPGAVARYEEALRILRESGNWQAPQTARILGNLAAAHAWRGDLTASEDAHRQALDVFSHLHGSDSRAALEVRANIVVSLREQGREDESIQALFELLEDWRDAERPTWRYAHRIPRDAAKLRAAEGLTAEAAGLYDETASTVSRHHGHDDPRVAKFRRLAREARGE